MALLPPQPPLQEILRRRRKVLGAATNAWNNASTADKASAITQGALTLGMIALSGAVSSGPAAAEGLADSALVVRGGVPTATQLTKGAESIAADGTLSGVSVQSANGASVEQLSQGIPNKYPQRRFCSERQRSQRRAAVSGHPE
jgi:hypothetical protein